MNRRLLQFLAAENITQTQLAETLDVAKASVSNILAGRNRPGYDFIESLMLHYPALSIEWLITGKGRMYRSEADFAPGEDGSPAPGASLLEVSATDNLRQITANQRKISSICVFFDDGTFQEIRL